MVAPVTRSARPLTSSATTANPRPCSPARAASIAAFRARRLVWAAMSSMTATILPISSDWTPNSVTLSAATCTAELIFCMPSIVLPTISWPLRAASVAWDDPSEAAWAFLATSPMAVETCATMLVAWSTPWACPWLPLAICSMASVSCFIASVVRSVLSDCSLVPLATCWLTDAMPCVAWPAWSAALDSCPLDDTRLAAVSRS